MTAKGTATLGESRAITAKQTATLGRGAFPACPPGLPGRTERITVYYVYILSSRNSFTVYVGITNNLSRRINEHISEQIESFTKKYHVHKLIYYEEFDEAHRAIAREKQIKHWSREKKKQLIESKNPEWRDLLFEGKGSI